MKFLFQRFYYRYFHVVIIENVMLCTWLKKIALFAGTKEDLPPTLAPTKPYDQQETLFGNLHFPQKNVLHLLYG
jgi:hypothetical protein